MPLFAYIYAHSRESDEAMVVRAQQLFAWLALRPETDIAIVTHSAFLSVLFNKAVACGTASKVWFENAELRTLLVELSLPPVP